MNHFSSNYCLTTKVGLSRSIKNIINSDYCDIYKFFPRSYDLNEMNDFEDFIEEYKFTKVYKNYFYLYLAINYLNLGIRVS